MLEVSDLGCARGDHRLFAGLNFSLSPGELMQVQGPNGSGKTTLLRTLCGLALPEAGDIRWRGRNVREVREEYLAELAYLGHHNAIKDELNALENLRINAGLAGAAVDEKRAVDTLRRMGLGKKVLLPVKVLSQGQRRRVALARLLVTEAPLWILDEPLTALDVGAVDLMQELIGEHLAKGGMVMFTTHQPLRVAGVQTRGLALA